MPSSITGRPDRTTTTSRSTRGRIRRTRSISAAGRASVAESPRPSAYGNSPTTTIPTSARVSGAPWSVDEAVAQASAQRGRDGGPGRDRPALPVPVDRPAAALPADVIGGGACQEHRLALPDGQRHGLRLEQHRGARHGLPSQRAMLGAADHGGSDAAGMGRSNRPSSNLTRRMRRTASSIRPRSMVPAASPARTTSRNSRAVAGDHHHVHAGADRLRHRVGVDGRDLVDAGPVGDHEALKPSSPLRTSVSRRRSPWTLPPRVPENVAITTCTPAAMAGGYGARWTARRVASSASVTPWSIE